MDGEVEVEREVAYRKCQSGKCSLIDKNKPSKFGNGREETVII
jgi:hypothetical protein